MCLALLGGNFGLYRKALKLSVARSRHRKLGRSESESVVGLGMSQRWEEEIRHGHTTEYNFEISTVLENNQITSKNNPGTAASDAPS